MCHGCPGKDSETAVAEDRPAGQPTINALAVAEDERQECKSGGDRWSVA